MPSSNGGTVHIIGAGLAGLAAAVRLCGTGHVVVVHEATSFVGGRCRSYYDQQCGMMIDNGTHLVLSANRAVLSFARAIGSADGLQGSTEAEFSFADLADGTRWALRFGDSRFPWWIFARERRVPQTNVIDYLSLARLAFVSGDKPIGEVLQCSGRLYERLLAPLLLAALNIEPPLGSAKLASAVVRETLAQGGKACRPLLARNGLGRVFVEPCVRYLAARGVALNLEDELVILHFDGRRATRLEFAKHTVPLGEQDSVILAVPPYVAVGLVPGLNAPNEFRGIVNAHFRIDPPADLPPMQGVINGAAQWIFTHPGRISVTVSDAGHLFATPREDLAQMLWHEVARVARLPEALPPWQIVRERRATFAATPEQNAKRPGTETAWSNVILAGDWTATGLPATLESAVRSGYRAAALVDTRARAAA
jgi:squalene-associated FAD-dependent desaturase